MSDRLPLIRVRAGLLWTTKYFQLTEYLEAINFRCFRGVSLDPRKINPTNFNLAVQINYDVFQVLQACYPATMTGEFRLGLGARG
jgi:hypothetical protein